MAALGLEEQLEDLILAPNGSLPVEALHQAKNVYSYRPSVSDSSSVSDSLSSYEAVLLELDFKEALWGARKIKMKRLVCQISMQELELIPSIQDMLAFLHQNYGVNSIQGVWANYYRDGNDYTPHHQDSYGGQGVFTFSFGASREMAITNKATKKTEKIMLSDGDVLFFSDKFNREYTHAIPKRTRIKEPRISVVFFL